MSSAINKYEHPFVTVDAVVLRYEAPRLMVLLTKRPDDAEVMGGRWALPGGFVNIDETLEDAMRRKVAEKTFCLERMCLAVRTLSKTVMYLNRA